MKPDELYSMSLKEFEQMRDARLEQEKIHDLQHAQISFMMATLWSGSENKAEIEDFMIYKPQTENRKQSPDEQLQYIEGMNAIMGGK